jgi:hypothetical protein
MEMKINILSFQLRKRYKILFTFIVVFIVFINVFNCDLNKSLFVGGLCLLIIVLLLFCFFKVNKFIKNSEWYKKIFLSVTYPTNDWYRRNYTRGYDYILLGDESIFIKNNSDSIKSFDWRREGQSLYVDFLVLKNFFSILKPGGIVYLIVTQKNKRTYNIAPRHESLYYLDLSKELFANNKNQLLRINLCRQFPVFLVYIYFLEMLKNRKSKNVLLNIHIQNLLMTLMIFVKKGD